VLHRRGRGPGMCRSGPRPYPGLVDLLFALDTYILFGIWLVAIPVGGYAFVHALMQRADAFTAADKLTKPAWLGITGASLLVLVLFRGPQDSGALFWLAGLIAVLVYIVDVKPAVVGVQGGGQRW
jgi:uncharacterized membrane protein